MAESAFDEDTANRIEDVLRLLKRIVTSSNLTVNEALFASLLIESSELDEVLKRLIQPLALDHKLLCEAVKASVRFHHARLAAAAEEFRCDGHKTRDAAVERGP